MRNRIIKNVGKTLNITATIAPEFASKKAFNLFTTPRKGKYTKAKKKLIEDAIVEVLQFKNINISTYFWEGQHKTILLVHGWESNSARWAYLFDDCKAEHYNIIALDAPAHGASGGKRFNLVLYSECINVVAQHFKPDVIIGHSLGGMASVFSLHKHNTPSVNKLILLGTPAHFTGIFLRYKCMMGYNHKISIGLDKIVLKRFNQPVKYFSAANFTAFFDIKGLIIHDKIDDIVPYEDALLIKNKFTNSKLITTVGFGHGLTDPSLVRKIIKFINK